MRGKGRKVAGGGGGVRQTVRVAVVDGAERMELLLPGGVPDGEVHADAVDRQPLGQERRLDGRQVLVVELVLDVPEHQRRLAHTPCVSRGDGVVWRRNKKKRGGRERAQQTFAEKNHLEVACVSHRGHTKSKNTLAQKKTTKKGGKEKEVSPSAKQRERERKEAKKEEKENPNKKKGKGTE